MHLVCFPVMCIGSNHRLNSWANSQVLRSILPLSQTVANQIIIKTHHKIPQNKSIRSCLIIKCINHQIHVFINPCVGSTFCCWTHTEKTTGQRPFTADNLPGFRAGSGGDALGGVGVWWLFDRGFMGHSYGNLHGFMGVLIQDSYYLMMELHFCGGAVRNWFLWVIL